MLRQLFGDRVGDRHGVNQHHHKEGDKVERGDQIADLFAVVVRHRAGDPFTAFGVRRQDKLGQRFVRPVG
ncbi:hypothetical protein D3C87_2003180 [compost metagenome]